MATELILFLPDDQTTWTAEGMQTHLQIGKMKGTFFEEVFGWNDAELQDAIQRANDALERAEIKLTEPLSPIRFENGTKRWTQGALKRLEAEAHLVEASIKTDRLFCLPHQKNEWLQPRWFRRDMMFGGRAAETMYDFPTITQKFFQFARDCKKETLKRETSVETGASDIGRTTTDKSLPPELAKKRCMSPSDRSGKLARTSLDGDRSSPANGARQGDSPARPVSQPSNAIVHVGWINQQDDSSFVLEKDFRSLRTWLAGPEQLPYNYDEIRSSLGMAQDPQLSLFWFEDISGEPWVIKSDHAIPGAIERMHSKGKICFLLARNIEHVRALTSSQRAIENQTVQTLVLDPSTAEVFDQQDQTYADVPSHHTGQPGRRSAKQRYMIPSISVSLARILGEQVLRSRIE